MKHILLLGAAGKTGIAYSRLLLREGFDVLAYDQNQDSHYPPEFQNHKNFCVVDEKSFQNETIIDRIDSVTLSPGVPLRQSIIQTAQKKGKKVFSEVDFCQTYLSKKKWIGVTGTDGKSTAVSLTDHILNQMKQNSIGCGNIGLPLSQVVLEDDTKKSEILTVELSSYQLELFQKRTLDVGVLLNIAPDHLNRYQNYKEYIGAKCSIVEKLKPNGVFITSGLICHKYFKENRILPELNIVETDALRSKNYRWEARPNGVSFLYKNEGSHEPLVSSSEILLKGKHNLGNILFALESVHAVVSKKLSPVHINIVDCLKSFVPLPHRFELIHGKYPEILYINDSKATTCQSSRQAIQNIPAESYLFLGGRGKGENYKSLLKDINEKKIKLLFFGEERGKLAESLGKTSGEILGSFLALQSAVEAAHQHHEKRGRKPTAFLLAPACASWDAYSSFEARGEHFKKLVQNND